MTVSEDPLVSVLTPVYNGEKYLAECIESVLAQTYQNWEYVIVNNCSKDRTQEIAQKYVQQDSRIRVHDNRDFVSMGENHNIALRQISPGSKYCKFVHADDWLFPDCLRQMVQLAEANPSVGIVGAYGLDGVRIRWDGLPYPSTVTPGREMCRRSLMGGFYAFGSPTSLLFRSDLIRGRNELYKTGEFDRLYSDQEVCYQTLRSSDFGFVHQVLTYSRSHDDSTTSLAARTGLNHDLPAALNIIRKYGPIFLSETEYERRLSLFIQRYYGFLGQSLLYFRGKEFWDFHRRALSYMGFPLSRPKLLKAACSEIVDTLVNPVRMALIVLASIAKSKNR
jgi:glycosyltransferase involved in cell wall biosynthesis